MTGTKYQCSKCGLGLTGRPDTLSLNPVLCLRCWYGQASVDARQPFWEHLTEEERVEWGRPPNAVLSDEQVMVTFVRISQVMQGAIDVVQAFTLVMGDLAEKRWWRSARP